MRVRRAVEIGRAAEQDLLLRPLVVLADLAAHDDRHRRRIRRPAAAASALRRHGRGRSLGRRSGVARHGFRIRQVDPPVARVLRMDLDVEHAAVLLLPDLRQAFHSLRQQAALLDDAQPAGAFGDEQAAVGEKREPPRRLDPPHDDLDLERLLFGLDDLIVGIRHVCRAAFEGRGPRADVGDELPDLGLGQRALERRHLRPGNTVLDVPDKALVVGAAGPLVVEEARRPAAGRVGAMTAGANLGELRRSGVAAPASPTCWGGPALALGRGGRGRLWRGRRSLHDEALQGDDRTESKCGGRRGPGESHARSPDKPPTSLECANIITA